MNIDQTYRGLLDGLPDAVVGVDRNGMIQLVNEQAEKLFGYTREELLGSLLEILIPERVRDIHPSHREAYFEHPTTRPMGVGLDLTARRKDGTEFPVDIALSALDTPEGLLVTAAVRDITEWSRATEEKDRLATQLQLHQAQRMESVGQLAGGVAHDFNNLLAAIMSYCQLIKDGLDSLAASETNREEIDRLLDDVGQVQRATERAAELTRQLLIFSRRDVVKPEVLDVNEIVGDLESLLQRTIGENITFSTQTDATVLVELDRGQLEQILMNLAVNARDAMRGGGRLQIRIGAVELSEVELPGVVEAVTPGTYLVLSVSDTGEGMTKDVQARAFEPFYTTKGKETGTGLGLATVYGIVTGAGGFISLYSEPGMGTTVKVYLPASDQQLKPEPTTSPKTATLGGGETILLVEDEDVVRQPARRLLESAGYRVLDAADPGVALRMATEEGHIDLLLTDVVMPTMNGKELGERLLAERPGLKIVFVSGYSEDVIVHQGAVEPGVVLVEKPFTREALLRTIRDVLDAP